MTTRPSSPRARRSDANALPASTQRRLASSRDMLCERLRVHSRPERAERRFLEKDKSAHKHRLFPSQTLRWFLEEAEFGPRASTTCSSGCARHPRKPLTSASCGTVARVGDQWAAFPPIDTSTSIWAAGLARVRDFTPRVLEVSRARGACPPMCCCCSCTRWAVECSVCGGPRHGGTFTHSAG